ncbi:MAG TPA: formylmethanofuran dehydrogenase subunit C [Methanothrix sp.]|nr:formylmethanofuran dehydrogenase subunit C [Methanothrix sp.]
MAQIILKPKGKIGIMLEAEAIRPDVMQGKKKKEIEELQIWLGPQQLPLAEFFDVEIEDKGQPEETKVLVEGDVSRIKRIGQGMKAGTIEITGSAGMHLGAEMAGGSIVVHGDAGAWAGMEMKGGVLQIFGDAGDHVGSAYRGSWRGMTGGQILIGGNARSQLGGGLAGGSIVVDGSVQNFCGVRQGGGVILVKGSARRGAGAEMTGGALVIFGTIEQFLPGFLKAGTEENPKLGDLLLEGRFDKFTGDYAISKNPKGSLYLREA